MATSTHDPKHHEVCWLVGWFFDTFIVTMVIIWLINGLNHEIFDCVLWS